MCTIGRLKLPRFTLLHQKRFLYIYYFKGVVVCPILFWKGQTLHILVLDARLKPLRSKFGFRKAKFGGKGVTRRCCNQQNSSGSGVPHHIQLHVTNRQPWALRSRLPGNEARSGHDSAAGLTIQSVRTCLEGAGAPCDADG